MRPHLLMLAGLVLVAACTGPASGPATPEPLRAQVTTQDPAAARAALETRMKELGFTLDDDCAACTIRGEIASGAPAAWFVCDKVRVEDESGDANRSQLVEPEDYKALTTIRVTSLGAQTSVDMKTHYAGIYRDRFDNKLFDQTCIASGELEKAVLAALAPAATS